MEERRYIAIDDEMLTDELLAKAYSTLVSLNKTKPKSVKVICELLEALGVDVSDDGFVVDTDSIWDVRAESKRLLAEKDLAAIVEKYEDCDLYDVYDDEEIECIIDVAEDSELWKNHRSEAVLNAYIGFLVANRDSAEAFLFGDPCEGCNGCDDIDEDEDLEDEEDEDDEDEE